jgi:predicted HTH transcriptional regulator
MTKTNHKTKRCNLARRSLSPVAKESEIFENYRVAGKMSQAEMARQLNISRQRMHYWLSGTYRLGTDWLIEKAQKEGWVGTLARNILSFRGLAVDI